MEEHVDRVCEFFYCVFANILIRDLYVLIKRYTKHAARSLDMAE